MQRAVGLALTVVGVLAAVIGAAIILVFGPDGRLTTGPHHLDTDGIAVVTAPKLIHWKNLQVEILAEVPVNKPVFVGIGNSVDVQAYLHGVRRLEVTEFKTPWMVRTRQVAGNEQLMGAPTALDWWIKQSAGLGGATINATLPDETVSAAVLSVGASNLRGLTVTVAYGLKGAFVKGLGFLLGGIGLAWAGLLARRGVRLFKTSSSQPAGVGAADETGVHEEVVYVWVDDDGVEHELTAEEAAEYEIADEVETAPPGVPPSPPPARVAAPQPAPVTAPPPAPQPPPEPVRHFWVDDDGVEHEVSEDELHEFEPYDPSAADAADIGTEPAPVLYYWIDDDGVEHEVTEDELHEFEPYDEEGES